MDNTESTDKVILLKSLYFQGLAVGFDHTLTEHGLCHASQTGQPRRNPDWSKTPSNKISVLSVSSVAIQLFRVFRAHDTGHAAFIRPL